MLLICKLLKMKDCRKHLKYYLLHGGVADVNKIVWNHEQWDFVLSESLMILLERASGDHRRKVERWLACTDVKIRIFNVWMLITAIYNLVRTFNTFTRLPTHWECHSTSIERFPDIFPPRSLNYTALRLFSMHL